MDENVRRPNTKVCTKCGKTKVIGPKNWYRNDVCGACYQKQYKLDHPEKYRDTKLRHLYGISLEQFNIMLVDQGGKCALCPKTENRLYDGTIQNFVVDHRHSDRKVRALLCHDCNKNVGVVEKHLEAITAYLKKY